MRLLLPLLMLLLPGATLAQYRPSYTPSPAPRYTPAPVQPAPTYTTTQQIHQRNFQRQQADQQRMALQMMQQNQQRMMLQNQQHTRYMVLMIQMRNQQQATRARENQEQAEQKATEQLVQLMQEQQRRRAAQPQPDEQLALAQKQADARELNRLTVQSYRDVFLPGQLQTALQGMALSSKSKERVQAIDKDLRTNAWWQAQDAAQTQQHLTAYGAELATLTSELLGFDVNGPTPVVTKTSVSTLQEQLAKDEFDRAAAGQLIQEASRMERAAAGADLVRAAASLQQLSAQAATNPDYQREPKKLREATKASMRRYRQELQRYYARVGTSGNLLEVQNAILKSTADYLERTAPTK